MRNTYFSLLAIVSAICFVYSPIKSNVFAHYLAFHTVVEMLSVGLSLMIFMFYWGIRSKKTTGHVSLLAGTFLAVALFDLFHSLSFKGMPDFVSANGFNKSIDFWLCARLTQSFAFFIMATTKSHKISRSQFIFNTFLSLGIVALTSWIIFYKIEILPVMLIEGVGLTSFKVYSEYLFITLNVFASISFYRNYLKGHSRSQNLYLTNASLIMVATGICFSQFTIHNDMLNFWGHILKAFCLVYIYKAILKIEILIPYDEVEFIKKKLDLDIENIRSLELELERSRKIASLGTEVGRIAHDLNNVLMIVNTSAHSILKIEGTSENVAVIRKVEQIKKAVEKSRGFLKSLVNFSKNIQVEKEVINLEKTFLEYQTLLEPLVSKNIKLNFSCEANIPLLMVPSDLEQLILNLVINARDAMENNDGVISISAEQVELARPINFLEHQIPAGEYLCIRVKDNGSGIKAEDLPKIFNPFFTTKDSDKGTGIGLATVVTIMQKNLGYIRVETSVNVGTTFFLYFKNQNNQSIEQELIQANAS